MNHEMANNRISQLPIAMAGIVHTFSANGISLSNFNHMVEPFARRCLP
ncbi:MAG: RAxF-45 family protein [Candidatus Pristimantibacillus sp.]